MIRRSAPAPTRHLLFLLLLIPLLLLLPLLGRFPGARASETEEWDQGAGDQGAWDPSAWDELTRDQSGSGQSESDQGAWDQSARDLDTMSLEAADSESPTEDSIASDASALEQLMPFSPTLGKRAASEPCLGILCPDKSTCKAVNGVPTCVCPAAFARLLGVGSSYLCSYDPLENSEYLDPQNAARAAVRAPPLVWNASIAGAAQGWANYLKVNNKCQAAVQSNRRGFGQNTVSQGYKERITTAAAMNRLVGTGKQYSLAVVATGGSSGCKTRRLKDCSPYIQTIWQYSTQVGCGYANCGTKGSQIWVCNYSPQALIEGFYPYSPCYKTTCPRGKLCNPVLGLTATCRASPCDKVTCGGGSRCQLTRDAIPYCQCSTTYYAVRNVCITLMSNADAVPQTSVAMFPAANFLGRPFVFRAPIPTTEDPGCVNLPASVAAKTKSIQVVWNVGDSATNGGIPYSCKSMAFWPEQNCGGSAQTVSPVTGSPYLAHSIATSVVAPSKSVSCV